MPVLLEPMIAGQRGAALWGVGMPELTLPPSEAGDLPRVTVELVMQDKLVRAYLRSIPRKQGRRFLRALFEELAAEEADNIIPIRNAEYREALREKECRAVAWARSRLPSWLLPPG